MNILFRSFRRLLQPTLLRRSKLPYTTNLFRASTVTKKSYTNKPNTNSQQQKKYSNNRQQQQHKSQQSSSSSSAKSSYASKIIFGTAAASLFGTAGSKKKKKPLATKPALFSSNEDAQKAVEDIVNLLAVSYNDTDKEDVFFTAFAKDAVLTAQGSDSIKGLKNAVDVWSPIFKGEAFTQTEFIPFVTSYSANSIRADIIYNAQFYDGQSYSTLCTLDLIYNENGKCSNWYWTWRTQKDAQIFYSNIKAFSERK